MLQRSSPSEVFVLRAEFVLIWYSLLPEKTAKLAWSFSISLSNPSRENKNKSKNKKRLISAWYAFLYTLRSRVLPRLPGYLSWPSSRRRRRSRVREPRDVERARSPRSQAHRRNGRAERPCPASSLCRFWGHPTSLPVCGLIRRGVSHRLSTSATLGVARVT